MLGIGFAAAAKVGLLLIIALTIEVLFLGLTVAAKIGEAERSRWQIILLTGALSLLLPVGALLALPVSRLSGDVLTDSSRSD